MALALTDTCLSCASPSPRQQCPDTNNPSQGLDLPLASPFLAHLVHARTHARVNGCLFACLFTCYTSQGPKLKRNMNLKKLQMEEGESTLA